MLSVAGRSHVHARRQAWTFSMVTSLATLSTGAMALCVSSNTQPISCLNDSPIFARASSELSLFDFPSHFSSAILAHSSWQTNWVPESNLAGFFWCSEMASDLANGIDFWGNWHCKTSPVDQGGFWGQVCQRICRKPAREFPARLPSSNPT